MNDFKVGYYHLKDIHSAYLNETSNLYIRSTLNDQGGRTYKISTYEGYWKPFKHWITSLFTCCTSQIEYIHGQDALQFIKENPTVKDSLQEHFQKFNLQILSSKVDPSPSPSADEQTHALSIPSPKIPLSPSTHKQIHTFLESLACLKEALELDPPSPLSFDMTAPLALLFDSQWLDSTININEPIVDYIQELIKYVHNHIENEEDLLQACRCSHLLGDLFHQLTNNSFGVYLPRLRASLFCKGIDLCLQDKLPPLRFSEIFYTVENEWFDHTAITPKNRAYSKNSLTSTAIVESCRKIAARPCTTNEQAYQALVILGCASSHIAIIHDPLTSEGSRLINQARSEIQNITGNEVIKILIFFTSLKDSNFNSLVVSALQPYFKEKSTKDVIYALLQDHLISDFPPLAPAQFYWHSFEQVLKIIDTNVFATDEVIPDLSHRMITATTEVFHTSEFPPLSIQNSEEFNLKNIPPKILRNHLFVQLNGLEMLSLRAVNKQAALHLWTPSVQVLSFLHGALSSKVKTQILADLQEYPPNMPDWFIQQIASVL